MIEEQAARDGCGCKAVPYDRENRDEEGRLISISLGTDINYCPLHAKAQEMYEALKLAIVNVEEGWARSAGEDELTEPADCIQCGIELHGEDERHKCVIGEWQALLEEIDNG